MEDAREELQRPIGRGIEGLRRRVAAMRAVEEADARAATAAAVRQAGGQQDDHAHQQQHHHHNHEAAAAAPERKKKLGKTIHPVDGAAADGAGALLLEDDEDGVKGEEEEETADGRCTSTNQEGGGKGNGGKLGAHRRITTEGDVEVEEDDLCCFDWGLLVEPVTLLCGHTFCRHCVGIMLDDSQTKTHGGTPHTPGSMKCPLCCRSLPAVLPQPNVRLRNDLRAKYPGLYEYRMETVGSAFVKKEEELRSQGKRKGGIMTPDDLQGLLAAHQRRIGRPPLPPALPGAAGAAPLRGGGFLRFLRRHQMDAAALGEEDEEEEEEGEGEFARRADGGVAGGEDGEEEEEEGVDMAAGDPVTDAVDLFQSELMYIWRSRRYICWILTLVVLVVGMSPLRFAPLADKAAHVEGILRVDSWGEWWSLPRCLATQGGKKGGKAGPGCRLTQVTPASSSSSPPSFSPSSLFASTLQDPSGGMRGLDDTAFPGSELLATVYMYPSWGWIERISRGVEGTVMDLLRVFSNPTPASILGAFPGFGMGVYALTHQGWSAPFRELVAFLAIEGEVRQCMALWTVLTIPTRIPRNPLDIPPLAEMPAYAWTVLSLTLAQGAYLLACEMFATLLDVVALSPMLLALTKGTYWRSEASLVATLLVRFWLMLRQDMKMLNGLFGRYTRMEATVLRLFIIGCVFTAPLWAPPPLYNSSDLVSALANAGEEVMGEIMGEVSKAAAASVR